MREKGIITDVNLAVAPNFHVLWNHLGTLAEMDFQVPPTSRVSGSLGLEWGGTMCRANTS